MVRAPSNSAITASPGIPRLRLCRSACINARPGAWLKRRKLRFVRRQAATNHTPSARNVYNRGAPKQYVRSAATFERWDKKLLHPLDKGEPVHCSFHHKSGHHAIMAQSSVEGEGLPMSMRRIADQPYTTRVAVECAKVRKISMASACPVATTWALAASRLVAAANARASPA
jgi:hypothetical protein